MVRYKVTLTKEEHEQLKAVLGKGKHSSQQYRNACILINSDEGPSWSEYYQMNKLLRCYRLIQRLWNGVKERFVEEGFEAMYGPQALS